ALFPSTVAVTFVEPVASASNTPAWPLPATVPMLVLDDSQAIVRSVSVEPSSPLTATWKLRCIPWMAIASLDAKTTAATPTGGGPPPPPPPPLPPPLPPPPPPPPHADSASTVSVANNAFGIRSFDRARIIASSTREMSCNAGGKTQTIDRRSVNGDRRR